MRLTEYGVMDDGGQLEELCKGFGDEMVVKDEEMVRIGFQNINGLKGRIDASHEVLSVVAEKDIDIMGLAEININWTDKVKQAAHLAMKMRFGQGQIVASSSRGSKEGYLPGGVAIITRGRMTGRIVKRGADEMGRYTWIVLNGRNGKQVMIISAYRTCKAGLRSGPHTANMQQIKHLLKKGVVTPNPRRAILSDLKLMIGEHRKAGGSVVLMMDANEEWERERNGDLAEFLLETGLEDIHKMKQQEIPTTTYARGTKRLDHILVTPDLVQTVRRAGYLPIHDGVIADHRLCYIDCNLVEFLGGNVNNIIRPHM